MIHDNYLESAVALQFSMLVTVSVHSNRQTVIQVIQMLRAKNSLLQAAGKFTQHHTRYKYTFLYELGEIVT